MFWLRKVLVFWTWNYHVLSIYWLSTGGFVPSDTFQAWLDKDMKVQSLVLDPMETETEAPCTIAGIMLASDATNLGPFASSNAWPVYIYFSNQSKYDRAKPTQHVPTILHTFPRWVVSCHCVACIK